MRITKRIAPVGLAGVLGLTGLGVAVVGAPLAVAASVASTSEDGAGDASSDRLQAIKDALADLVTDGSITQDQADKVAATLADSDSLRLRGPAGPGGDGGMVPLDLDAAADALGLTRDELWDALSADGTTLADVAKEQDVETAALVDSLVAAAEERIEQAVADGRLTQEQADDLSEAVPERIAAAIDREFRGDRGRGPRRGGHPGDDDGSTGATS